MCMYPLHENQVENVFIHGRTQICKHLQQGMVTLKCGISLSCFIPNMMYIIYFIDKEYSNILVIFSVSLRWWYKQHTWHKLDTYIRFWSCKFQVKSILILKFEWYFPCGVSCSTWFFRKQKKICWGKKPCGSDVRITEKSHAYGAKGFSNTQL